MGTRIASTAVFVAATALIAGSGLIWSPDAHAQTVQACAQKESGIFRLLLVGTCKKTEIPFSFDIQGPKGDKGDKGDPGSPGISGLERMDFSSTADSDSPKKAFAKCPSGKQVISGGAQIFIAGSQTGPVVLKASFPSDTLDGWAATAEETAPFDEKWFVTAFAICGVVAP